MTRQPRFTSEQTVAALFTGPIANAKTLAAPLRTRMHRRRMSRLQRDANASGGDLLLQIGGTTRARLDLQLP